MSTPEANPPGPEQMHALAQLVPRQRTVSLRTSHALKPLLSVLAQKWVRDFLFTASPIHIQHLLNPTLATNSLTCFMGATSVDPQLPAPMSTKLHGDSYHMAGHALYVPAFSADYYTLGVGVIDAYTSVTPWLSRSAPGNHLLDNLRFARDARSRTLLTVYDAPADDCFVLQFMSLETATKTHNFTGFFRRRELLHIIENTLGPLTEAHLLSTVTRFQDATHPRACAVCGAAPTAGCGCTILLTAPKHPHDSDFFMRSMFQHVSASLGTTNTVLFGAGGLRRHIVLGSRIHVRGIVDLSVLQRLRDWSLAQHARESAHDPLQAALLAPPAPMGSDCSQTSTYGGNHRSERRALVYAAEEFCAGLGPVQRKKRPKSTAEHALDLALLLGDADADAVKVTHKEHNALELGLLPEEWEAGARLTEERLELGPPANATVVEVCTDDKAVETGIEQGGNDAADNSGARTSEFGEDAWWADKAQGVLPESLQGSIVAGGAEETAAVVVDLDAGAKEVAGEVAEEVDPVLAEKRRRAAVRREKNREAARRSNLRHREMRDQIRAELREVRGKIPGLLERELQLRKQNLDLREQLRKGGGGQ